MKDGRKRSHHWVVAASYLDLAQQMHRAHSSLRIDQLGRSARLAMIRRAFLDALDRFGFIKNPSGASEREQLSNLWHHAKKLHCPLLNSNLDGPRTLDGMSAVLLTKRSGANEDLGQLYQTLRDFTLAWKGRGEKKLILSSGRSKRRQEGLFFTPEWMAKRLAKMALEPWLKERPWEQPGSGFRILDPACGSGRLLLACLNLMGSVTQSIIANTLHGVDRDPIAVAIAQSELWFAADPRQDCALFLPNKILVGDAIAGPLRGRGGPRDAVRFDKAFPSEVLKGGNGFSVIVGNPPFEVYKDRQRASELSRYAKHLRAAGYRLAPFGNLNAYRFFIERALDLLEPNGRLAFVAPYGFLMDKSAAPLRTHLIRSGWLKCVEVYPESARTFQGVGQSVVLLLVCKRRGTRAPISVIDGTGRLPTSRFSTDDLLALNAEEPPIPVTTPERLAMAKRMREQNHSTLEELAEGRVGEVDQTLYRRFIQSDPSRALLVRGTHLSPYLADLDTANPKERWLEAEGFSKARGNGKWREDICEARIVQTGIVNMEGRRRFVAAEIPPHVYLGNSVNTWVPKRLPGFDPALVRGYLLGLLNSAPLEWRFRLTSSNNNINLYEMRKLSLPKLSSAFPARRRPSFLSRAISLITENHRNPSGVVRQITALSSVPFRDDFAVAMLIGMTARLREKELSLKRQGWLDAWIDHLVIWHLGMDEPDLLKMQEDIPARAWKDE
jgi:adenine-specific DNA-methyltransferase